MRQDSRRERWSLPEIWKKCAAKFQLLRRLQCSDANGNCQCVTCGKVGFYKTMQGGHFITRARKSTLLNPHNVHPQCVACNQYGYGKPKEYARWMIDKYGEEAVHNLELASKKPLSLTRGQLLEIYESICEEVKQEERRVKG